MDEVEILLKMASELERKNPIANATQINALCRASVVLLCSHIEGYTKEIGELTLSKIVEKRVCRSRISNLISYFASRDLISEIKDTSDSGKIARKIIELFDRDLSLWEQTGPHPKPISEDRFNKSFASPSFKKIASYVGRFGYSTFKRDLEIKMKGDYSASRNLIDHIVELEIRSRMEIPRRQKLLLIFWMQFHWLSSFVEPQMMFFLHGVRKICA